VAPRPSVADPAGSATARVFWSGRSQAVRLPKEFRLAEGEVTIRRDGSSLVIEPLRVDRNGWPAGFFRIFGSVSRAFDLGDRSVPHERPDPLG
jgi:antitoxin VapB